MTNEYKLAPSVPTDEMLQKGYIADDIDKNCTDNIAEIYKAMLKDAPTLKEVDPDALLLDAINFWDKGMNFKTAAKHAAKKTRQTIRREGGEMTSKDMPDTVLLQMNYGWGSVEEVVCGGTQYIRADIHDKRVTELLQSNNDKLFEIRRLKDELKAYKETRL